MDQRPVRNKVGKEEKGKDVLNVDCYTGSFRVYAASGKAKNVTSVDLSKKYLQGAENNMKMNGFSNESQYFYIASDVKTYLENLTKAENSTEDTNPKKFDIIILDPPTFSNSKKTETTLDINRDWEELVYLCINVLKPNGTLYFSTNSRRLVFDESKILEILKENNYSCTIETKDISEHSIPEDFRNTKIHRAWKITRN